MKNFFSTSLTIYYNNDTGGIINKFRLFEDFSRGVIPVPYIRNLLYLETLFSLEPYQFLIY